MKIMEKIIRLVGKDHIQVTEEVIWLYKACKLSSDWLRCWRISIHPYLVANFWQYMELLTLSWFSMKIMRFSLSQPERFEQEMRNLILIFFSPGYCKDTGWTFRSYWIKCGCPEKYVTEYWQWTGRTKCVS